MKMIFHNSIWASVTDFVNLCKSFSPLIFERSDYTWWHLTLILYKLMDIKRRHAMG